MLSGLLNRRLLQRAERAEKAVANAQASLNDLITQFDSRAALACIEQTGRAIKFTFIRNGMVHVITTYATMSDDVAGWRRDLLE